MVFDLRSVFGHKGDMNTATNNIKDKILNNALADIPFDGLKWEVIVGAAEKAGYDADVALSVFPKKLTSFLAYFSEWADMQMLDALKSINKDDMKIRDLVAEGVWQRLQLLTPYKDVMRQSLAHWINPLNKPVAVKMVWATSDVIWKWAGDNATDYNKYTKRGLLSGVISATTLAWLNDSSEDHAKTRAFLDRRIDNVLVIGRAAGKILKKKS